MTTELKRSNRITTYWAGDGIAVGTYYKTHDKILTVKSDDAAVITAGFVMPEGIPAVVASEGVEAVAGVEVTPQDKLEAFKNFLAINASSFGIVYDPIDRRPDEFKFPNKYDEAAFIEYSKVMLGNTLQNVIASVQSNVIDKMIASGHVAAGSVLTADIGDGLVSVSEKYNSGSLKYATATYPTTLAVADNSVMINVEINLVSGQLKKPREFGMYVFTMTGIKTALIEAGILPKIEKEVKEDKEDKSEGDTEVQE